MLNIILLGFLGSLAAGLATGVGALPVLFVKRPSKRYLDLMLGFAAGVMLAASVFGLLIPAIDEGGVWVAVGGMLLGALVIHLVARLVRHEHFIRGHKGPSSRLREIWLFVLAITIHNFPKALPWGLSSAAEQSPLPSGSAFRTCPWPRPPLRHADRVSKAYRC